MMKRIIALFLALILTVGLLPTVALAAEGDGETSSTNAEVVIGKYNDKDQWEPGTPTSTLPDGVKTVSKTAKPTTNDNEYEVTLQVVLQQTEENSGKAATVLVLDTSVSMAYCAECGVEGDCVHNYVKFNGTPNSNDQYYYKTTDKNGKEEFERAYYCGGNHTYNKHNAGWFKSNKDRKHTAPNRLRDDNIYFKTTRASRLDAAKVAAENFLKTYSGLTFNTDGTVAANQNSRNLGRYVSVVSFAEKAKSVQSWVDVSNSDVYQKVLKNIKGLSAEGGTNLDAGLTYAEYLLNDNTVRGAVKNVIALTDGQPTYCLKKNCNHLLHLLRTKLTIGSTKYCVHGDGTECTDEIYNSTVDTATRVKNVPSKLYTVCFDAGETIDVPDSQKKISVSEYLRTKIATQPKAGEKFAYDASNAEQLYAEFAKITQSIVSGLNTGTVKDTLPTGITSAAFGEDNVKEWKLNEAPFTKNETTNTVGGKQVTTYTYTYTYTVTINPLTVAKTEIDGAYYAPLNGKTTLTVKNSQGTDVEIPFPIPAGKVTMPSHTVTWKSQDGITTLETDNNVEYNTQPSFDQADPTKADDAQYTYTFVGWATEANKETGTLEADLPPVTDDVTYYAAFSKTPRTYTVTWMPQDGQGNAYETDTGVAYNARPSYDGTEPTKAADAEHTYTFVGWATTPNQTSGSAVVDLPNVTADVTYYAAFSATKQTYTIRFETEAGGTLTGTTECTGLSYGADFPAAPTTTSNVGYYFAGWYDANDNKVTDWPNTVTENATYTAKWLSYNSINLDLTGKIQKTLNSDVELSNQRFTINVKQTGAEVASATATATATATVSATTASGTGYTGSAPFQKDDFKLIFTAPGTYIYSIVEAEDGQLAGMTYDVGFANGHTMIVNVDENTTTNELYVKSVTIDGKTVYTHGETEATPTWLTITNNYVEPKNAQVTNKEVVVTQPEGALKTAVYAFETTSEVTVLYPTGNGTTSNTLEVPYGTTKATLLYKITVYAGTERDYTFEDVGAKLVYAEHANVAQEDNTFKVTFENGAEYAYVYVAVTHVLKFTDVFCEVLNSVVGHEAKTTVTEKAPNSVTVDFSQLVCKKLTVTGDKAFTGATFEAVLDGEWHDLPTALSLEDASAIATYAHATPGAAQLHKTLTVSFDANDDLTQNKAFTGSITFNAEGVYTYTLKEVIPEGATGYDTSEFLIQLWIKANSDAKLEVKSVKIKYNNQWEDLNGIILFENTIDTGRDDYIPIIIPTIINKDTGMLNKTDHFAYVIGYPDGTVHPNGQITRAEVATIFFRLLRDEVRDGAFTTSNAYSDVAYGKWYNNPISTMSALGIITGYPDGTFKPNKPITRAEFAAIAARFDETQSGKSATFSDVIGHWAAKEIGIAYYNDWIKGYPDGTFKPDQNITRAEAMTLINRVLERKPESPADLLTNMNKWTDNMDTSKWYYLDVQEATNSHAYTRKTFNYELWRQMLPDPDWSRYER